MRRAEGCPPLSMLHMTILNVQDRAVTCRLSASPFVCMHWTQYRHSTFCSAVHGTMVPPTRKVTVAGVGGSW